MSQKPTRYFSMSVAGTEADIFIFGDIVIPMWQEFDKLWGINSETSGLSLAKDLQALDPNVTQINVHINSYGGHVSEGLAIHNMLRQHPAKVLTIAEGFAASAASVVFEAGDERVMRPGSLLFIHKARNGAEGDPEDLHKAADDLATINQATISAYMRNVNISEDELNALMSKQTWILPADALAMGFATAIDSETNASGKATASARQSVMQLITAGMVPAAQAVALSIIDAEAIAGQIIKALRMEVQPNNHEPSPPAAQDKPLIKMLTALMGRKGTT